MTVYEKMTLTINSYIDTAQRVESDGLGEEKTIRRMIDDTRKKRLELTIEEASACASF